MIFTLNYFISKQKDRNVMYSISSIHAYAYGQYINCPKLSTPVNAPPLLSFLDIKYAIFLQAYEILL